MCDKCWKKFEVLLSVCHWVEEKKTVSGLWRFLNNWMVVSNKILWIINLPFSVFASRQFVYNVSMVTEQNVWYCTSESELLWWSLKKTRPQYGGWSWEEGGGGRGGIGGGGGCLPLKIVLALFFKYVWKNKVES